MDVPTSPNALEPAFLRARTMHWRADCASAPRLRGRKSGEARSRPIAHGFERAPAARMSDVIHCYEYAIDLTSE